MITDEELMKRIDQVSLNFTGQFDDLSQIVGIVIVGRRYGWRVIRLVHSRRAWTLACKYFGDLKEILPEEGEEKYMRKSVGFSLIEGISHYWEVVKGHIAIPSKERKSLL